MGKGSFSSDTPQNFEINIEPFVNEECGDTMWEAVLAQFN